jgi:hypothetical protein
MRADPRLAAPEPAVDPAPPVRRVQRCATTGEPGCACGVDDVLDAPGAPLPRSLRTAMEARFDTDFSEVRVHDDARAAGSADRLNALAYTVGSDIAFAAGRYQPGTPAGDRLLAHELTHVVQQRATPAARANGVSSPHDPAEVEADRIAGGELSGAAVPLVRSSGRIVARQTGGGAPPGRIVYLDANVLQEIARGNAPAATALRGLLGSGAQVLISEHAYQELVTNLQIPRSAVANQLLIDELGIRRAPPVPPAQLAAFQQRVQATGVKISAADAIVMGEAAIGGGEVWTFDKVVRTNPTNLAPVGVRVAPETTGIPPVATGQQDYRVARRLLGLQPVEVSLTGRVGGRPPSGGGGAGGGSAPGGGGRPAGGGQPGGAAPPTGAPPTGGATPAGAGAARAGSASASASRAGTAARTGTAAVSDEARAIAAESGRAARRNLRLLRAARLFEIGAGVLQLLGALDMLDRFIGSAQRAVSGEGLVMPREVAQAQSLAQRAEAWRTESADFSTRLQADSFRYFAATADGTVAGKTASRLFEVADRLTELRSRLPEQVSRLAAAHREVATKRRLAERILHSPAASGAIAGVTFGTGELAQLFGAYEDLGHIESSLDQALTALRAVDQTLTDDLGFANSWAETLFDACRRAGICSERRVTIPFLGTSTLRFLPGED